MSQPRIPEQTPVRFAVGARNMRQMPMTFVEDNIAEVMDKMGFGFKDSSVVADMARAYGVAMDSIQPNITTPSIPGLVQFLQQWLPGQVYTMTAKREIDEFVGIQTQGAWEDEQVVQALLDPTGYAIPYGDYTNVPLSDWNQTYPFRTVVRFELGMRVNNLEELRAARVRANSGQAKREACGRALEICRNLVGFNGYNSGNDNTYGFLSDPGLSAYVTVANTGSGSSTEWKNKTFLEIQADLLTAFQTLRTQSQGNIDAKKLATTLAVATNAVDYLSVTSDFGISVMAWLNAAYPMCRVVDAIQLNTALGTSVGDGVFYLYADAIQDQSTDDGRTFVQPVPTKFLVLGVQKLAKGYEEDYSNATAGIMCKRPWAVVRFSGIS